MVKMCSAGITYQTWSGFDGILLGLQLLPEKKKVFGVGLGDSVTTFLRMCLKPYTTRIQKPTVPQANHTLKRPLLSDLGYDRVALCGSNLLSTVMVIPFTTYLRKHSETQAFNGT